MPGYRRRVRRLKLDRAGTNLYCGINWFGRAVVWFLILSAFTFVLVRLPALAVDPNRSRWRRRRITNDKSV